MDGNEAWLPRGMARPLAEAMADTPVVCVLGPRQSGKSSLVRRAFPQRAYYTFEDDTLRQTAEGDPAGFVAPLPPEVTLDDVHRAPAVLRAIKMAVDEQRRPGRFLLTGSANLRLLPSVGESLAGRMEIVRLHPLTESEKERKPGRLVADLLEGKLRAEIRPGNTDPSDLIERVLRGGYPEALRRPRLARLRQWHRDYLAALMERDAHDVANLRNLDHLASLLAQLSAQTAQLLNVEGLARLLGIRRETVQNYMAALERLFLIRTLPAWHPNEARRLIKAPKVHLVDSGLTATLASVEAEDWTTQRDRFGHAIESFVVQQVIAQGAWTDPDLRFWHYRDKDQVEVDLVITRGRHTWGVEVKAGATVTPSDSRGLLRLAERCGRDFRGGILMHAGVSTLRMADRRLLAVPLARLWEV